MDENSKIIEFDLINVWSGIKDYLKGTKYFQLGIIFIAISLITFYSITAPKYYETHMTAYSEVLPDSKLADLLEDICVLISNEEYFLLSRKINVDLNDIKKIKKISLDYPKDEASLKEHFGIKIKVKVYDSNILPKLEKAISYYANNVPFVKERFRNKRLGIEKNITSLKNEIKSLEILKDNINVSFKSNSVNKDIFLSDVSVASSKIIELSKVLNEMELELSSLNDFQIVKGFSDSKVYSGPNLLLNSTVIFFLTIVGFNIITLFLSNFIKIK
ncbi:MAG: hypothetical protein RLZZ175_1612 [Bacteroidota bacterium]|jgi:hypothetical protein